jgi:hypothetical protein
MTIKNQQPHFVTEETLKQLLESLSKPVIDPTANVLSLVGAAMQRQDDLRAAENRRINDLERMKEHCSKETDELREKLRRAESMRIDAVNLAESRRVDSRLDQQQASVAIASKEAVATAEALRQTAATSLETTRAAIKVLEEKQYQWGGRSTGIGATADRLMQILAMLISIGAVMVLVFRH